MYALQLPTRFSPCFPPLGELVWVDPKTYKVTHRLTIGPKPNQIACTPDGRWVYVPCNDQHYWVIDAKAKKVVKKIKTGGRPHNTQCSRDGRFIERLGFYNPIARGGEIPLRIDLAKVDAWVAEGAQPSERVKALVKKARKEAEKSA